MDNLEIFWSLCEKSNLNYRQRDHAAHVLLGMLCGKVDAALFRNLAEDAVELSVGRSLPFSVPATPPSVEPVHCVTGLERG